MTAKIRYNKAIELLEQGRPVFCWGLEWNGDQDDLTFVADSDHDMAMVEAEHEGSGKRAEGPDSLRRRRSALLGGGHVRR